MLLAALPFAALAAGTYWLLLSGTDINFYLAERPPRFLLAAGIGVVLFVGLAIAAARFFVGWAFAVPACVLEGRGGLAALRSSLHLPRAAAWRLLLSVVGWQLLKLMVVYAAILGFDRVNEMFMAGSAESLTLLVWSTVFLLLFEAIALQLIGARFAIGTAFLVAYQYQQARRSQPTPGKNDQAERTVVVPPVRATRRARAAILAIVVAMPVASLFAALAWSHQFVEHRLANVTAHRAGSQAAPENSLAALRLAIEAGADYVEIDVQQTPDGHVVLLHDRDLRRVAGDPRPLDAVGLSELQDLRLREVGGFSDERIPTLVEFLNACDGQIRLNVELKDFGDGPRLALAVLEVLRERGFLERAVVSCFEMPPLRALKKAEPRLPVGVILSAIQGDATRLPIDFLSVHQRLARGELVRRAHERGQQVHVWGVSDREIALRLLDLGCDNLITPNPVLIRKVVDEYARLGDIERMLLRLRRWLRE
jgi:glycerophosphoryl diester phosphodiesterase